MRGYYKFSKTGQINFPFLKNNIAFFSDSYSFYNDTIREFAKWNENSSHLFFSENDRDKITFQNLKTDSADKAVFERFDPEKIIVQTSSSHPQLFTLLQHDYPDWTVSVDGKQVNHFTSDYLFMTVFLPEGRHTIEYSFRNKKLIAAGTLSVITLVTCLLIVVIPSKRKQDGDA
jgi:hypothetical protein